MTVAVEKMFYIREVPWHGLGIKVEQALSSKEVLVVAGLNWQVNQKPIYTSDGQVIPNYKANVRDSDSKVLGIVTDRYQIVSNKDAFAFTDTLIGEGVRYESAGSLQDGRRVWMLAKLPEKYIIGGEAIEPFLIFSNSHDGSAAIKVAMSPIRIACSNVLNLALSNARRTWSAKHTGSIQTRMHEARGTLGLAHLYMKNLGKEIDMLSQIKLSDSKVMGLINELIPLADDATAIQRKNVEQQRDDAKIRFFEAPDLKVLSKNGFRFVNAISDFATHAKPLRETSAYKDNLFMKVLDGHPIIDRAYEMIKAA